jgi:hypothetical protein
MAMLLPSQKIAGAAELQVQGCNSKTCS